MTRPKILEHYLEATEQWDEARRRGVELSEAHLLNEAEWCLYNAYENEASAAYGYHPSSKAALRRYVDALRAKGVEPRRDFD